MRASTAIIASCALLSGCRAAREGRAPQAPGLESRVTARTSTGAAEPARVAPRRQTVELVVEGHQPALVSFPASSAREPLVVAVHGAGDGPEWQCSTYREILGDRGVILCPAGRPFGRGSDGYFHANHHELERLVQASVAALYEAHPGRVATGPAVYIGYSQGATMGALMIVEHASRFRTLVLVEGGYSEWNVKRGLDYRRRGGERVLFACGTRHCRKRAEKSAGWLEQAGLEVRVVFAEGAGHTYGGAVAERLRELSSWVLP